MERTWEPSSKTVVYDSKLYIYDGGEYIGFYIEGSKPEWKCHRVLQRSLTDSIVTEVLEEMPEDWVPFHVYSEEVYPLRVSDVLEIPGWIIRNSRGTEAQRPLQKPNIVVLKNGMSRIVRN